MKFSRNVFYPIRLILYPVCIQIMFLFTGTFPFVPVWIAIDIISTALLVEAIWEFIVPYAELQGDELIINSSIIYRTRIDLSKCTADDVEFDSWFIRIGKKHISLRRFRRDYRERFEECIENYYEAKAYREKFAAGISGSTQKSAEP